MLRKHCHKWSELKYTTTKLQCLVAVWAIQIFWHFLAIFSLKCLKSTAPFSGWEDEKRDCTVTLFVIRVRKVLLRQQRRPTKLETHLCSIPPSVSRLICHDTTVPENDQRAAGDSSDKQGQLPFLNLLWVPKLSTTCLPSHTMPPRLQGDWNQEHTGEIWAS